MSWNCPSCNKPAEPGARFCGECGAALVGLGQSAGPAPPPLATTPAVLALAGVPRPATVSVASPTPGSELVVEVETNRRHVLGQALLLRFRVTNNLEAACGVTIIMRLQGQDSFVVQDPKEMQQCCQFDRRGDQNIFSFPFQGLVAGTIAVSQLQVVATRPDRPGGELLFELPDRSLLVQVSDPAAASQAPGIVISGGINLDLSQLREMYGSDIKNLLNLHVEREAEPGQAAIQWQPIRLRVAELPPELQLSLPGDVKLELMLIRAGEFLMGSPAGQGKDDERPARRVRITRDFYLGKFPVTQQQYQAVMGVNPSKFAVSPQHPVENVSWEDSRKFCRRLRQHLVQTPAAIGDPTVAIEAVSLPTEAQWEYACRAGAGTRYAFGDDRAELPEYGWFEKNSQRATQAVGQLRPNAWKLFDMHGNVWEWCEDYYLPVYPAAGCEDPKGPAQGERRVMRGGSWSCYGKDCRSASRHSAGPLEHTANYGFRILLIANRGK